MISTNFSFVLYDNEEGIFNVSLLDLDVWLKYITVFSALIYLLCLIVLNIAVVINSCLLIHIYDGFTCVMDLNMLLHAFYSFMVKENVL